MFALLTLGAAGCGLPSGLAIAGAGLANFIQTDKLPSDYIAELATKKQCSAVEASKDGGPLCRDTFDPQYVERPIYCYRTLGAIACYNDPDPYGPNTTRVR